MNTQANGNQIVQAEDAVLQTFAWGQLRWFANGQIGNSQTMTVGQCVLKPGCANFRHSHPNCEEILQVTSGRIIHSLADETFPMGPGDTIVIPPHVIHNAQNVGDGDAVMTIVFSTPNRATDAAE